jgi:Family of unknown function (DUF6010)
MTAAIIGISSGLLTILLISILKQLDKTIVYGLILSGIGFLYVGYVWTDLQAIVINSIQAVLFLLIAYFGIKKNMNFLAAGYFLHGAWDMVYHLFQNSNLIPPHYDLFCLSIDFTMGFYLLLLKYRNKKNVSDLKTDLTPQ